MAFLAGLGVALTRARPWDARAEGRTGQGRDVPHPKSHPQCPQTVPETPGCVTSDSAEALALQFSPQPPLQDQLRLLAGLINTQIIALN